MPDYLSIIWNINPEAFNVIGLLSIHWSTLVAGIGLLISFEYYLYRTKRMDRRMSNPVSFFIIALLGAILGAKIMTVLLSDTPVTDQIEAFNFSLFGGVISLIIIALFNFKKQPKMQLRLLDISISTVLLLLIFLQIGSFLDSNSWGKPTENNRGLVFTSESTFLLEGIFDKISKVEVIENDKIDSETGLLPLILKIHFIEEVKDKKEAGHFLNADFKNSLVHNPSVNAHFKNHLPDQLAFELEEKNDRLIANVHINGILRHPVSIYKALAAIIIIISTFFIGSIGRLKNAGEKGAFMLIFLILSYQAIDYFFTVDFQWQFLSELLLAVILLLMAIWLIVKTKRNLLYKNQKLV